MEGTRDVTDGALYEDDFVSWTERQAAHLREGRLDLVDLANIAEEIESLGKSQISALRAAYRLIAMHLLKLMRQPEKASASWENTINRERGNVAELIEDNPGMKPRRATLFAKAYVTARADAAFETGIDVRRFPEVSPFTLDEVESKAFWPAGFPRDRETTRSRPIKAKGIVD